MLIALIIAALLAVLLGVALFYQVRSANKQSEEGEQLLKDYQKRVDEQQRLLDDYRALEKNFDNVGQGYEQALLAFDKMEEETQKMLQAKHSSARLQRRSFADILALCSASAYRTRRAHRRCQAWVVRPRLRR